ncbi:response regulator receiver protein [Stanieria cyanosphaera PCC 7437]|uniref:Response regulator receiver protein n=1 Tax=Stanieria cyanosphaera (strain ATCC 29371 / PCC 7437) TaxID=111780 RepID=K9XT02_STAC7|nr:response regulator [Stanieria cyanosphaera]AFZ35206.1 response regulator receiver protein [Stanieria cyanosphaera PCC 7437]
MITTRSKQTEEEISKLRVLVVDDDRDSRDLLLFYLEQIGAKVKSVASAKVAVEEIQFFQPEIILSDIFMPEENGFWLINQLKKMEKTSNRHLAAIAITAAAKAKDREKILSAGYDAYLSKPFLLDHLTALIAKVMQQNQQNRQKTA